MSAKGPYDRDLLASAPAATKAQLQEGYTTDLLDPNHGKTSSPNLAQSEQSPLAPQADTEQGSLPPAKELNGHLSSTKPVPFWRTTKGIIIIIVAIVVVLAAVIGGAVGGTRKKSNATTPHQGNTTTSSQGSATTLSEGGATTLSQGVGSGPVTTAGAGQGATPTAKAGTPSASGVVVGSQAT